MRAQMARSSSITCVHLSACFLDHTFTGEVRVLAQSSSELYMRVYEREVHSRAGSFALGPHGLRAPKW